MCRLCCLILSLVFIFTFSQKKYVLVVHGGAGTITKENMTPEKEALYRAELTKALQKGYEAILKGKPAVEAVQAAIVVMEDSPLFNAGKGSVFTNDGKNELDASVMDGKTKAAGAVAGVRRIKNPIRAAIAVMQKSEHVMMAGEGAERFARQHGLEMVDPKYFWTKERWDGLQILRKKDLDKTTLSESRHPLPDYLEVDQKFGTVGCVALDQGGHLAAGTSTGGMTNKKYGRIGDAPIIGAGTYANQQVGISCTGWGEFFIRSTAARTAAAKMEYHKKNVGTATLETIEEIARMGGSGGIIALDENGNMAMPFNTAGMYRGAITDKGEVEVEIYK